jgi:signal transduction histidine kinase
LTLVRRAVERCSLNGVSGIKISIDIADDTGHVEIDEEQFNEVIRNRVINAIEAIEERRKKLSDASKNEGGDGFDGGCIRIRVEIQLCPKITFFQSQQADM